MFIWTDSAWTWDSDYAVVRGLYDRDGAFMVNFFVHQPALNYGFNKITRSWQQKTTDEGPKKTRDFIIDVMKFWCSKGVDGYRCDMADSLVKTILTIKMQPKSVGDTCLKKSEKNIQI